MSFKELELLIDKSLHGEADETDQLRLKELINESDEAFQFYLEALEQQSALKEWAEMVELEEPKVARFPLYKWFGVVAALLVCALVVFVESTEQPNIQLSIHSISSNYKLIRHGEMLTNEKRIQKGDQLLVGADGQVRLDIEDQESQIFLMENSSVNFVNRDCNKINLQQGEIRAKLEKQKTPFIIKTNEGEAEIIGTEFSLSDKGETQLWVTSGKVKLNRGKTDTVFVEAGQRIDTESFQLEDKVAKPLIPNLYQGVEYAYYHNLRNTLTLDDDMRLIDQGYRSGFAYLTGAYDGYVRAGAVWKSYVSTQPFLMVLRSYYKSERAKSVSLKLTSLRASALRINEKLYDLNEQGEALIDLQKGFNLIEVRTIGGKENDTEEALVNLAIKNLDGSYSSVNPTQLFYSSTNEVPDLSEKEMAEALTCDLPLRNDLMDRVHNIEAQSKSEPKFIEDEKMGSVLLMNQPDDYLTHLPADELGLNGSYTVSCKVYFNDLASQRKPDDPLFSTVMQRPVLSNSTLVLLLRRRHPYLAHYGNDSIASEKLNNNQWYDITFRFHDGVQSIFVDGEMIMSSSNHSNLYCKNKLLIGEHDKTFLKGRICDVKIYNRALSRKNIQQLSHTP